MIFFILMLILVGVVAFFHYLQGFFSATISVVICILAAVLAMSYHETIVMKVLGGKMANQAHAMVLLALFALIYLILRTLFDAAVPGNIRLPATFDKIGAGLMGVVAGVFAAGIVAIAAQELPFTPQIAGYARYDVADRAVVVPGQRRATDGKDFDELKSNIPGQFGKEEKPLLIPVDDIVVNTVEHLSNGGALDAGVPFSSVHPHFLTELFGQRLGIEPGTAHRIILNLSRAEAVRLDGLFLCPDNVTEADAELKDLRKLEKAPKAQLRFVARVVFDTSAADEQNVVHFSPGSVRLVTKKKSGSGEEIVEYHPVGTLEKLNKLYLNKVDDFLYVDVAKGGAADLVFDVDRAGFVTDPNPKAADLRVTPDTFLEVNRSARMDLAGQKIAKTIKPSEALSVIRKTLVENPNGDEEPPPPPPPAKPAPQPESAPAEAPAKTDAPAAAPTINERPAQDTLTSVQIQDSDQLPVGIVVPKAESGPQLAPVAGGFAKWAGGKFTALNVNTSPISQRGGTKITALAAPDGQKLIQVSGIPNRVTSDTWAFGTKLDSLQVVDSAGKYYTPIGVCVQYTGTAGQMYVIRFSSDAGVSEMKSPDGAADAAKVWLTFAIPANVTVKTFSQGSQIRTTGGGI